MSELRMSADEMSSSEKLIRAAFYEDLAGGEDFTTNSLVPENAVGKIAVVSRCEGLLCGNDIARKAFEIFDATVSYIPKLNDGDRLAPAAVIAEVSGSMRSLLTVERTALNFLTMLSGISTFTHQFVTAVQGSRAKILDTRKTHPGLRQLQKYAVRCGGGTNHRMGLFDAVLIKDNHLAWLQDDGQNLLFNAVNAARDYVPSSTVIEIEVDTLGQFQEVLPAKPHIVLLDNMTIEQLRQAVAIRNASAPDVLLEASGGITLETVANVAATRVDRISVGALTHSAVALDIGFDWKETKKASA